MEVAGPTVERLFTRGLHRPDSTSTVIRLWQCWRSSSDLILAPRLLFGRFPVVQKILVAVHRQPRGHRCRTVGGEMPRLFRHVHDVALVGEEDRKRADAVANLPLENHDGRNAASVTCGS